MVIQWFPGHMTKALRMMEKEIKIVDAIIYVLDARAPFSCVNPKLNTLIGNKPIVYVLNKIDLANSVVTKEWQNYFLKLGNACIALNSTDSKMSKKISDAILSVLDEKIKRQKAKGIKTILRAMVLGVPNSGKSTLINNISGSAKTATANKPGVTRGKQWIKVSNGIELLDTPGTLWPAFNNNQVARHLAYIGSIKEEVLDITSLSLDFIKDINLIDANIIKNRYNISFEEESCYEILKKICVSRGFLLKKSELDLDRGAFALINDFKQGKLGEISLEQVADIKKLTVIDRKFGNV